MVTYKTVGTSLPESNLSTQKFNRFTKYDITDDVIQKYMLRDQSEVGGIDCEIYPEKEMISIVSIVLRTLQLLITLE